MAKDKPEIEYKSGSRRTKTKTTREVPPPEPCSCICTAAFLLSCIAKALTAFAVATPRWLVGTNPLGEWTLGLWETCEPYMGCKSNFEMDNNTSPGWLNGVRIAMFVCLLFSMLEFVSLLRCCCISRHRCIKALQVTFLLAAAAAAVTGVILFVCDWDLLDGSSVLTKVTELSWDSYGYSFYSAAVGATCFVIANILIFMDLCCCHWYQRDISQR